MSGFVVAVVIAAVLPASVGLALLARDDGAAASSAVADGIDVDHVYAPREVAQAAGVGERQGQESRVALLARVLNEHRSDASSRTRPVIVPRATWDDASVPFSRLRQRRGDLRDVLTHIVVHHSDFVEPVGARGILEYHRAVSGFADLGYHFVIEADGTVVEGRDLRAVGAHAGVVEEQRGQPSLDPDHHAIGIVLDGYFVDDAPSEAMTRATVSLVDDLSETFRIPPENLITHREVRTVLVEDRGLTLASPATTCPGDALFHVVAQIRSGRLFDVVSR